MTITIILSIIVGFILHIYYANLLESIRKNKRSNLVNNQYKIIFDNIENKSIFKNRINNTVYIKTELPKYGDIDVLYFIDKRDIVIFKDDKCIITSELVSKNLLHNITQRIDEVYSYKINDIVEVLGIIFYREDFEKTFNVNLKELRKKSMELNSESEVNEIVSKNSSKLNVDDILDKIGKFGIKKLTKEEKDFLDKHSKQ